jgi:hypothetical protein
MPSLRLDPAFVAFGTNAMPERLRERPILFSAPMVRAILAGSKTQTRRIVKFRQFGPTETKGYDWTFRDRRGLWQDVRSEDLVRRWCHYGVPGDRLWVRETFYCDDYRHPNIPPEERTPEWREQMLHFRADVPGGRFADAGYWAEPGRWKPSIHMPRWASRITLEITSVRVERLQEITEEDALAEGVDSGGFTGPHPARAAFVHLWSEINGAESWHANPWVWVVAFKRVQP